MKFNGFEWDEGNWPKCQEHGLTKHEIESVFENTMTIVTDPYDGKEERFRAIGTNAENKYIFVVFCLRELDEQTLVRPISARYMHTKEIRAYEQDN